MARAPSAASKSSRRLSIPNNVVRVPPRHQKFDSARRFRQFERQQSETVGVQRRRRETSFIRSRHSAASRRQVVDPPHHQDACSAAARKLRAQAESRICRIQRHRRVNQGQPVSRRLRHLGAVDLFQRLRRSAHHHQNPIHQRPQVAAMRPAPETRRAAGIHPPPRLLLRKPCVPVPRQSAGKGIAPPHSPCCPARRCPPCCLPRVPRTGC